MSLSILFEDDTVLFLDAVTSYVKDRKSNISENPVDKARVVTDHVHKDNLTFNIKGIVSSADFHSEYARPSTFTDDFPFLSSSEANRSVNEVEINSGDSLLDLLPGSIRQFISEETDFSGVTGDTFRGYSHESARDRLNQAWDNSEVLTILDYDYDIHNGRTVNVRVFENCLIQTLTDTEDVETGDSYQFSMTLKEVRFANVKEVRVNVADPVVADAASGESKKGNQTGQTQGEDGDEAGAVEEGEALTLYQEEYKDAINETLKLFGGSIQ